MTRLIARNIEWADKTSIEIFRRMTGEQKRRAASQMFRAARSRLMAHLRHQNPDWTDEQVSREAARRISRGSG